MLPLTIKEHMNGRYDACFVTLLKQWGAWAAGKEIKGYDTGHRGGDGPSG